MLQMDMVIDGQWGSTGKGKMAYYLARRVQYAAAFTDNGPNAGHTIEDRCGIAGNPAVTRMVFQQLPVAAAIPEVRVFMGPGSVVDVDLFLKEVEMVGYPERVAVHPTAAVITPEDRINEQQNLYSISSTMKGAGAAAARRSMRCPDAVAAACPALVPFTERWQPLLAEAHKTGQPFLIETSQGFDLSVSSRFYPFTTSRDVNPLACLARCGFGTWPGRMRVIGCLRLHPIRVGSLADSSSGGCWPDQHEISWESLGVSQEITTVTKRVRRVFTWSDQQFANFLNTCAPTHLFFNFAQYMFPAISEPDYQVPRGRGEMRSWLEQLFKRHDIKFDNAFVGYGADDSQMYVETIRR